ncbi:MAG: histidinol dehydrogenase [Deltaproteobacteria bacterium]|jgi:histidinol dehydrogenase|nr:histidinol dehydrogenase [Deltaproteobacteria bacterium]
MLTVEILAELSPGRRQAILARSVDDLKPAMEVTRQIFDRLKADPEKELLREYSQFKPNLALKDFKVAEKELAMARKGLTRELNEALLRAKENIERFHLSQLEKPTYLTEIAPGLLAGRVTRPLSKVGVYIPGGRAAYPSSALMNVVPAKVAGVKTIVAVTPPGPGFKAWPIILAALELAGATEIYKLGGAWAVGCLAYGLGGVPKVDKIVGPGSSWVTAAKMAVFGDVDIDQPAGPSEGFIIADGTAKPDFLAWDFISQLEHDPQASAVLVSADRVLAEKVAALVKKLLPSLDRAEIINQSLANAAILVAKSLPEAFDFANEYAPEHLELALDDAISHLGSIQNAGSIFLGHHSPIPAGDYATGPNHVLPTGGSARAFSGLSTDSFLKKMTFQKLTPEALADLAPTVTALARAEGLPAHAKTIEARVTPPTPSGAAPPDKKPKP